MTKEKMAALLDGREYPMNLTTDEEETARRSRLLVIFGSSDDLCELRGVLNDEAGAPGKIHVTREDGRLLPDLESDEITILQRHGVLAEAQRKRDSAIAVKALWCLEKGGPSWTYKTDEPHATFNVMEDGEVYCRGIVLQLEASK